MRVLGSLLIIIAVLLFIHGELAKWVGGTYIRWQVLVAIILFGTALMYYDYRYNVIPTWADEKHPVCPYCGENLWIDQEDGTYFCNRCQRSY